MWFNYSVRISNLGKRWVFAMQRRVEDLEQIVGNQVKRIRIRENLTQEELSARSNISKSALFNLENGRGSTVKTLVSVLNTLGETAWLDNLAPNVSISPIQLMELGKPRQRVRRKDK
jgi:transcriptional regulator with XRE-family HTH domain